VIPLKDDTPSRHFPIIMILIIASNVYVYILEMINGQKFMIYQYGCIPSNIIKFQKLHTLFTSMFLHGSLFHLASNMLFLYIFGDNVEDFLGHFKFLIFYLGCGLSAALVQSVALWDSRIPMVGASGAISGVMGGYLVLYPRSRILTLVPLFPFFFRLIWIPAFIYLIYWVILQLIGSMLSVVTVSGIAFTAHLAGFFTGLFWMIAERNRRTLKIWIE